MLVLKAVLAWLGLMALAMLNGIFRQFVLLPNMGELPAHQVTTVILCVVIFIYTWLVLGWWPLPARSSAWMVGITWAILTVAFKFVLGAMILKKPMPTLIADYNLLAGRIWPLALLSTLIAPAVLWRASQWPAKV